MKFDSTFHGEKLVFQVPKKFLWLVPYKKTVSEWKVLRDFRFYFDDKRPKLFMLVKAGFTTDLASAPWFVGFVVQKDGPYAQPATNHDNSYRYRGNVVFEELDAPVLYNPSKWVPRDVVLNEQGQVVAIRRPELRLTRKQQDQAFLDGMEICFTNLPIRIGMWRAVRRFGWIRYPKTDYLDEAENVKNS